MTTSAPSPMLDSGSRAWALAVAGLALLPLLLQLPGALATGLALTALATGALAWRKPLPAALRFVLALTMLAAVFWSMGGMRLGRDTGCALLAAMLAIKPAETASLRDARSLAGFALFAPFAAFLLDQGPLSMALGLLAALASLRVLQRLTDAETGTHPSRLGQDMAGIARLVGVGLPLALVTFWLFPRLATPLWGIPERALARPGLSERMTPGEWVDLMNDDSPALRAQFFGAEPTPQELYWRGPTLWDYDGREWRRNDWAGETPPAIDAETGKTWDYQIEYEATDRRLLVALDLATAAPAGTRLTADHALVSERPLTALTRWRLQSTPPAVYQSELPPSLRQRATSLPPGYNPRTLALAAQWRAESSNDGAIVDRALTWIRSEFAYTLDTPLPGRDAVDEFLFTHKRGFCEHFSSAFVVLMRAAGIPARVVTGYTGGYRNPLGNYWVVRRQDAHAWAEVWLPRSGWTRVDPTAAVAPERIYDTLADRGNIGNALAGGDGEGTRRIRMVDISDWLRRGWNDLVLGFNAQRQQALLKPLGLDGIGERGLGLLFAACALLALLGMAWLMARGQRERDPLLRAWHALGRRYAGFGLARLPHEPALAWAQRVADHHPQAGAALLPLSQRFVNARYASGDNEDKALPGDLRRHRPKDFHSRRLP